MVKEKGGRDAKGTVPATAMMEDAGSRVMERNTWDGMGRLV
jgi:hypothetical protein